MAHQTAESPELLREINELMSQDQDAEFVLLVPATPVQHLLTWTEGESVAVARARAESARARLEATGANVVAARVGNASPLVAIGDELRERPDEYEAIVICTLRAGLSRWLKLHLPSEARRRFRLPIIQVIAEAQQAEVLKEAK